MRRMELGFKQRRRRKLVQVFAACAIVGLAAMAGVLGAVVLRTASSDITMHLARETAIDWSRVAEKSIPRLPVLATGAAPTMAERREFAFLTTFGPVSRFQLFNHQGVQVIDSDQGGSPFAGQSRLAKIARSSGMVQTRPARPSKAAKAGSANDPEVANGYTVYIPIRNSMRDIVGTAAVHVDATGTVVATRNATAALSIVLPIIIALVIAIPAFGILRQRNIRRRIRRRQIRSGRDTLTGVPDRMALMSRAGFLFANRAADGHPIGVMFIDVDKFKAINDQHGHVFGDRYLRHIARTIQSQLRDGDLVGRFGGDEFVVILPNIGRSQMRAIGDRILIATQRSFSFGGRSSSAGTSVGLYISPPGEDLEHALRAADEAANHAKALGRGQSAEFFGALAKARVRRQLVEESLTRATETGDFGVEYRPIHATGSDKIIGFEAAMTLSTPEGVPIDPQEFMPVAESTAMIRPLGLETIRRACTTASTWPEDTVLEVGLTSTHFASDTLCNDIERILTRTGFPAERLIFVISERVLPELGEQVSEQLVRLTSMGASIAADRFGAGQTGLADLWRCPFQRLKVDPVLLENYEYDPERFGPLIRAIVALGRGLDMTVILDGVDRDNLLELVRETGCAAYQGAMAGAALAAEETSERLAARSESDQGSVSG